jgi:hypothetical protein
MRIKSVGIEYARNPQLTSERANIKMSVWADIEAGDNLHDCLADLWGMVEENVKSQYVPLTARDRITNLQAKKMDPQERARKVAALRKQMDQEYWLGLPSEMPAAVRVRISLGPVGEIVSPRPLDRRTVVCLTFAGDRTFVGRLAPANLDLSADAFVKVTLDEEGTVTEGEMPEPGDDMAVYLCLASGECLIGRVLDQAPAPINKEG